MATKIIEVLNQSPNLDSNKIAETIGAKNTCVKVTLNKLIKANRLVREKVKREQPTKVGPQNLYVYKVNPVVAPAVDPQ